MTDGMQIVVLAYANPFSPQTQEVDCTASDDFLVYGIVQGVPFEIPELPDPSDPIYANYFVTVRPRENPLIQSTNIGIPFATTRTFTVGGRANDIVGILVCRGVNVLLTLQTSKNAYASIRQAGSTSPDQLIQMTGDRWDHPPPRRTRKPPILAPSPVKLRTARTPVKRRSRI